MHAIDTFTLTSLSLYITTKSFKIFGQKREQYSKRWYNPVNYFNYTLRFFRKKRSCGFFFSKTVLYTRIHNAFMFSIN